MHTESGVSAPPKPIIERRVIGGVTLYPEQIAKLGAYAKAHNLSRAAAIRKLIDLHA
ncbi:hypothetical protein ACH475_06210 [Streptomyces globisporus]|uniref:hypothetical protein n=1 Tax=Streptomyces globisporus TaxID=1908 RepID=UPI0036C0066C